LTAPQPTAKMQLSRELREVLVAAFPKSARGVSVLDREGMTLVWSLLDELLRVALLPPPTASSSADETQHNDKKRLHTTGHLDGVVAEQRWRDLFLQHHVEPEKEGSETGPTRPPQALVDAILSGTGIFIIMQIIKLFYFFFIFWCNQCCGRGRRLRRAMRAGTRKLHSTRRRFYCWSVPGSLRKPKAWISIGACSQE